MQGDRQLDGSRAVSSVEALVNKFAARQRDAIKAYEAWRVKQQLRTSTSSAHGKQMTLHATEVCRLGNQSL